LVGVPRRREERRGEMSDLDDELLDLVARPARRKTVGGGRKKRAAAVEDGEGEDAEVAELRSQIGWVGEVGDGYDADLLGDDADRGEFDRMGEVDREMLLEDRREKRRALNDRLNILLEGMARRRGEAVPKKREGRKASGAKEGSKAARAEELAAIREKRAADAANRGRVQYRSESDRSESEDERRPGDSDEDYYEESKRGRGRGAAARRETAGRGRGRKSAYDTETDEEMKEEEDGEAAEPVEELKDLLPGWVGRAKILQWLLYPDLGKILRGAFVRLHVGKDPTTGEPVFKIAEVDRVGKSESKYRLRELKHEIDTVLTCSIAGKGRDLKLVHVSDSMPSEAEFRAFKRAVEQRGMRVPSRQDVAGTNARLRAARNKVFSAEEVKHIVGQKKAISGENPYKRKHKLKLKLAHAVDSGDGVLQMELEAELREVENVIKRLRSSMIDRDAAEKLSRVNKRHKGANLGADRRGEEEEYMDGHDLGGEEEKGDGVDDTFNPFMRRPTRSVNYAALSKMNEEEKAAAMLGGDAAAPPAKSEGAPSDGGGVGMNEVDMEEAQEEDPNDPWADVRKKYFRELDEEFKDVPIGNPVIDECPLPRCATSTEVGKKLFSEGFGKVMAYTFDFDLDVPVEMPPPVDQLPEALFYPPMSSSPASNLRERKFGRIISLAEYRERLSALEAQMQM